MFQKHTHFKNSKKKSFKKLFNGVFSFSIMKLQKQYHKRNYCYRQIVLNGTDNTYNNSIKIGGSWAGRLGTLNVNN